MIDFNKYTKAERAHFESMRVVVFVGVAALIFGVIALISSQPYAVYYPLLLGGLLAAVIPGVLLPTIRRRYEEHELRRMHAQDAV